jgi:hypothetical protein
MKEVRCLKCMKKGHANCMEKLGNHGLSKLTCFICGFKGHSAEICPEVGKVSKLDLFREHVNEAMKEIPSGEVKLNFKERRYWDKVNNKAYKKLLKKEKLKKNKKKKDKEKRKKLKSTM